MTKWRLLLVGCTVLLASCTQADPVSGPSLALQTTELDPLRLESPQSWPTLRWPAAFLAQSEDRFLWAEGNGVFSIAGAADDLMIAPFHDQGLNAGFDRIVAAAQAVDGSLAILDASGRVSGLAAGSGEVWSFETELRNPGVRLALADRLVYFLLARDYPGGPAVGAHSLEGMEVGRWGTMPADGVIQQSLNGGGIAACADGSVYYNYLNSPWIQRLQPGSKGDAAALGKVSGSRFERLTPSAIRRAHQESTRSHSVAPLVKLGLSGSRVLALFCTEENLLARQVDHPHEGESVVELWDPQSGRKVGSVNADRGLLLAVRQQTLFLGVKPENEPFTLQRFRYRLGPDPRESDPK